jgi:hypothetical protein
VRRPPVSTRPCRPTPTSPRSRRPRTGAWPRPGSPTSRRWPMARPR